MSVNFPANVYNKMKTLRGIIDSLDQTEIKLIRDSPLGGLLDFQNKPAWTVNFGLFLLGLQLDIAKSNEIDLPANSSVINNDVINPEASQQEADNDSSTQSGGSNHSIASPGEEADSESQGVGQMGSEPMQADVPSQSSVVGNPRERRSKRLRTRSSKLDGRFQFDKKTKLLVGHPSPIATLPTVSIDPEERFNNSMKKLKAISSISLGDGAHAVGGMDDCVEFLPDSIDAETKKLVSVLILAGVP
ncbi:hypothetical protein ISN45_Aa05g014760 [Arabidopsis thaliana x Arabidopsis arenosa]|uniref:Uncharacterized protein n=1 Tax=Arabidopsis thaliana x Arabidopsis arenosa TaxID=1240361 RepID=A0A8T1ZMG0_9BRAS|nr:hypothetical protein ISN45_Aa05g014760 [Arabidopsis thaliana x Arabidopsis arenosa]